MEFLPKELVQAMREAQAKVVKRRSRLRVVSGEDSWPVLRKIAGGVVLDAAEVTHLRGNVALYEGSRHLSNLLIVASEIENGELICRAKRETSVTEKPPLDFVRAPDAPMGYLPRA